MVKKSLINPLINPLITLAILLIPVTFVIKKDVPPYVRMEKMEFDQEVIYVDSTWVSGKHTYWVGLDGIYYGAKSKRVTLGL